MKIENRVWAVGHVEAVKAWSTRAFSFALDHVDQQISLLRVRIEPEARGFVCRARAFTKRAGSVVEERIESAPEEAVSAAATTLKTILRRRSRGVRR